MIEKIGHYSLTERASVYDEEALTALELAGRTAAKVNECVKAFNELDKDVDKRLDAQDAEVGKRLDEQDASLPEKITQQVDKFVKSGMFDEAIEEHIGELEERLDNLVNNVPEGSTTMDIEVIDIRLDADGKTHNSAGEAVRSQVLSLAKGTSKPNLINPRTLVGGYVQTTGNIHPSHQTSTYQNWEYTTDLIPVASGVPYTFSFKHKNVVGLWYAISTYDKNGVFIDRPYVYEANTNDYARTFTFPEGVCFVRVSYRSFMTGDVKFEQSSYATQIPTKEEGGNLLTSHPLQFNGYIIDNGSIYPQTANGYFEGEPALLEMYSTFIPVNPGESYTLYHKADKYAWGAVGMYSADGKGVQRITVSADKNEFTIPEGVVAIMVCARTYYLKDLALFKQTSPMCAEQRTYENFITLTNNEDAIVIMGEAVKAINHRGYNTGAPENTLPAFELSANHGFKYVECDVRFTLDGVPVLLHDQTVDRTSNGTGDIGNLTFEAVRALDFGSGEKIPSYEEFIALCKSLGLHAYVELKASDSNLIKKVVSITRMYGMRDNVSFISFNNNALLEVRALDAKARIGYVTSIADSTSVDVCKAIGGDVFLDLEATSVNDEVVALCVENDIPLEVWTVNNEASIVGMNPYISGVTSDNLNAGVVLGSNRITGAMTTAPQNLPTGKETHYLVIESEG